MFSVAMMATDLSPSSDAMVRCANALEALGVRRIVLFHALSLKHLQDVAPWLQELAEPRLADQAAILRQHGFDVRIQVKPGLPSEEIVRFVQEEDIPLLVLAATSDNFFAKKFLLGSVATHVLHDVTSPVLVLHQRPLGEGSDDRCSIVCEDLLGHIVFGTDFSDTAERAFLVLEALAPLGIRRVTLVHVQDRARIRTDDLSRLEEFNRIDRGRLERLRDVLLKTGVSRVDLEIPFGSPAREIVALSEGEDVTMVVMGTQGRSFFGELLLGSVAHQVARRASVPTLLVPPKVEDIEGTGS